MLDEPTNHLDNGMSEWLEEYLIKFRGAILMVTHDRYFLDRVANRIVEVDQGKLYSYPAVSYTHLDVYKRQIQGHEADVKDVALRLIRILSRSWKDKLLSDEPFIMAAPELYPSEAMQLEKSKVLGFVTRYGTINSHTAVIRCV